MLNYLKSLFLKAVPAAKLVKPTRFFMRCHSDGIPPARVRKIVEKWGKTSLIGVDPGLLDYPEEDSQATIDEVKKQGAMFLVYLVGPGMESWSPEEARQVKYLAASVGIDVKKPSWRKFWKNGGWEKKVKQQFEFYNKMGAYACEIDNLDGIWEQDPTENVEFFVRLQNWRVANNVKTKLCVKNLNGDQLQKVLEYVEAGKLSLDLFCEFGMFEDGTGNIKRQIELSAKLGD
jgi:hypothetical protein